MSKFTELPEGTPHKWPEPWDDAWGDDLCPSTYTDSEWSLVCTGPEGHDGPHVAEGVSYSLASWED